ncbi:MAG: Uma2 family endonuclease [Myxococcales bacterium]|nr:Uma2 family endonuclease [Myxococcales bacterium]
MTASSDYLGPRPPRGEDLPYDDGEPMESERHREQMQLLIDTLRDAWRERWDYYVGGNMAVYFSETQARNQDFRAPDFFVVLDVERRERKSWVVWEEGGRSPDVVIELLSATTEEADRGRKKQIYERALRVPFYAMYDPVSGELEAYSLDVQRREYVALPKDERGAVECAPLGFRLGPHGLPWKGLGGPWLRWIDADGQPLDDASGRAERASARADREAERAQHEAERAQHEAERAAQETARAEREAERAAKAEQELARLRALLAQRGD